jgi:hypothetical protein
VVLGNLAEVTMMREDLEGALELYAQAVSEGNREERVLGLWGMAVVLDRLGEKGESLERAKQALRDDVRPMGVLKQSSIFFVPAYEGHYYDGLGFRALAELEADEGDKAEFLVRGFARTLARTASPNALMSLKHRLVSLEEEGHRTRLEPLYAALERTARKLPRGGGPSLNGEESEPGEAALKALVYTVQAVRAFARYLDRGGDAGPWAEDARAHLEELSGWFSPRHGQTHGE